MARPSISDSALLGGGARPPGWGDATAPNPALGGDKAVEQQQQAMRMLLALAASSPTGPI